MKIFVNKLLAVISFIILIGCQEKENISAPKIDSAEINYQYDQDLDLIPDAIDTEFNKDLKSLPHFKIKRMKLLLTNNENMIESPASFYGLLMNNSGEFNIGALINDVAIYLHSAQNRLNKIILYYDFSPTNEFISIQGGDFFCGHKEIILPCYHDIHEKTISIDLPSDRIINEVKIYYANFLIKRINPALTLTDREYFEYIKDAPQLKLIEFQNIITAVISNNIDQNINNYFKNIQWGPYENIQKINQNQTNTWAHGNPSLFITSFKNNFIFSSPSSLSNTELKNDVRSESSTLEIHKHRNHHLFLSFTGLEKVYTQKITTIDLPNNELFNNYNYSQQIINENEINLYSFINNIEIFYLNQWIKLKDLHSKLFILNHNSIILHIDVDKIQLRLIRRPKNQWVGTFSGIDHQLRRRGRSRDIRLLLRQHSLHYPSESHLLFNYFLY